VAETATKPLPALFRMRSPGGCTIDNVPVELPSAGGLAHRFREKMVAYDRSFSSI